MPLLEDLGDEDVVPSSPEVDSNKLFTYKIQKDAYDSVIRQHDTSSDYSVLQYLEGSKWTVNYYNQNLSYNDSGSLLDEASPGVLRPLTKINNFMLYVTTPLSEATYDAMTGSAIFFAGDLRPFVGDNFIVPILNRKLGIFQVTSVQLKSYVDTNIYTIDFEIYLINDTDAVDNFIVSLESGVNREFYYNPDFLRNRSSVLFTEEETNRNKKASEALEYIHNIWLKEFKDYRTNLITTKKQKSKSIDVNLEKFFLSIIKVENYSENPVYANTTYSPFGGRLDKPTIMDLLLNKTMIGLSDIASKAIMLYGLGTIDCDLRGGDLSVLGFDNIIFPYTDDDMLLEIAIEGCYKAVDFTDEIFSNSNNLLPNIYNQFILGNYIFSGNFYSGERNSISVLEELLLDYIEDKELNLNNLFLIVDNINKWKLLEKFYFYPFVYLLLNYYKYYSYSFVYKKKSSRV